MGTALRTRAHRDGTGRDAGRRLSELSGAGPSGHVLTGQVSSGPSGLCAGVGVGTARPGPSPARAGDRGGRGLQTRARRTPGPHVRRGRERDGGASAADPLPAGRGRLCGGGGGAAWTRPGLGWLWEVEGRPRSAAARVGGRRGGTEDAEHKCKGKLCTGGRGLRLRCGAEGGEEGGGEGRRGASQPAAAGRGERLPRGKRGEEPPGSEGGPSRGCGRGRWGRGPA